MNGIHPVAPVEIAGHCCLSTLGLGDQAQAKGLLAPPAAPSRLWLKAEDAPFPYHRFPESYRDQPTAEIAVQIAEQALEVAGLSRSERRGCALFLGSSGSSLPDGERAWSTGTTGERPPMDMPGGHDDLTTSVMARLGMAGPRFHIGTACSSSANALLYGWRMVGLGKVPAALVLGVEQYNQLSLRGFESLMLLASEAARPFDRDRDGLVLGEGLAALVLTPAGSKTAHWRLCGGASRMDISNPTQSSPEGIADTLSAALEETELRPVDIAAVKAHGTATPGNDRSEGIGLRRLFGSNHPPVSSIKGSLGHTLGACGAVEASAVMAAVDHGFWPANHNFRTTDPECGLTPCQQSTPIEGGAILLNFFGFGGNNCALLLEPPRDD